jgi:hypothetical protein
MTEPKILVGIPYSEKPLRIDVFLSWMRFAAQGHNVIASEGPTPLSRAGLARTFMANEEFTHLLMLDLDHIHMADVVDHVKQRLMSEDPPKILGGLHFQRQPPYKPCVFMFKDEGLGVSTVTQWPQGVVETDAVGMGTLCVAREVFETLGQPYFQFAYVGERFIGEDIWFCNQARKAGYKIWVDFMLTSLHQGTKLVGEKEFREWMAENLPNNPKELRETTMRDDAGG